MDEETKVIEHLKLIEPIINRFGSIGITLKGFSLSLFSILLTYGIKEKDYFILLLNLIFLISLLFFSSYYLWQENLFKKLYDNIRQQNKTDFSMETGKIKIIIRFRNAITSISILPFYTILIVINTMVLSILKFFIR